MVTPFNKSDEGKVRQLQVQLATQLHTNGHEEFLSALESPLVSLALMELDIDHDVAAELASYNAFTPEPGFRIGIVAFPADSVPDLWWSLNSVSF